eukprot:365817-Chlamydomonas_euryale.AAC.12
MVQCTRLTAAALHLPRPARWRECAIHGELQPLPADIQPAMLTMRPVELVDMSKGYMQRVRAAEVAEPVAAGRNMRGRRSLRNT